ncbi:MAG: PAS domain S-box protein [Firmicutes bacterium]|nr:PAS domain S-box protein [Bacillota bacterium]
MKKTKTKNASKKKPAKSRESALSHDRQLTFINEFQNFIIKSMNSDNFIKDSLDRILKIFNLKTGVLFLYEEPLKELRLFAVRGMPAEVLKKINHQKVTARENKIAAQTALKREPIIIKKMSEHPFASYVYNEIVKYGYSSMISSPLIAGKRLIGVFQIMTTEYRDFSREDIRIFEILCGQLAVAIDNFRKNEELKQEKVEAEKLHNEYELILHKMNDGVVRLDRDGRLIFANRRFYELTGFEEEDVLGKNFLELTTPPEDMQNMQMIFKQIIERGETPSIYIERLIKRKDGSEFYVQTNLALIKEKNQVEGTIGVIRDITAGKERQDYLNFLTGAIRDMLDPMTITDLEGRHIYANKAFEVMTGYSNEEIKSKKISFGDLPGQEIDPAEIIRTTFEIGSSSRIAAIRIKSGKVIEVEYTTSLIRDEKGDPLALALVLRDIAKLRELEENVRSMQSFFEKVVEASPDYIAIINTDGVIVYSNKSARDRFGDQYMGKHFLNLIAPEFETLVRDKFIERKKSKHVGPYELRAIDRQGRKVWLEINTAQLETKGEVSGFLYVIRDIDARKDLEKNVSEAEQELLKLKEYYESIIQSSNEMIVTMDLEGKVVFANQAAVDFIGHDIARKKFSDLFESDMEYLDNSKQLKNENDNYQIIKSRTSEGEPRWLEISGSPIKIKGTVTGSFIIARDVTDKLAIEETLKYFQKYSTNLIENANSLIIAVDNEGRIMTFNKYASELTGYSESEVFGKHYSEYFSSRSLKSINSFFETLKKKKNKIREFELGLKNKEDKPIQVSFNGTNIIDENGASMGILVIGNDITEKKRIEKEIRRRNKELAFLNRVNSIVHSSLEVMEIYRAFLQELENLYEFDWECLTLLDHSGLNLLVVSLSSEKLDETAYLSTFNKDLTAMGESIDSQKIITVSSSQRHKKYFEDDILDREGIQVAVHIPLISKGEALGTFSIGSKNPNAFDEADENLMIEMGTMLAGAIEIAKTHQSLQDLYNNLKDAQEQIIRAEKMSAIGVLSAGISHEYNNLLAGIKGLIQLALQSDDNNQIKTDLNSIEHLVDRASEITRNVLNFSRAAPQNNLESKDINHVIDQTTQLISYQCKKQNIKLEKDYASGLPLILMNEGEMHQVVLNILINAIHSLDKPQKKIKIKTGRNGEMVFFEISDNGHGIEPENLSKIFDPFFTTKGPMGTQSVAGTGLGLSVAYGIIKSYGGRIDVNSTYGKGTTFTIYLPIFCKAGYPEPKEGKTPLPETCQSGAIERAIKALVIDDEEPIRNILTRHLSNRRIKVTAVESGSRGLNEVKEDFYDIVFLDFMMEGRNGLEILREIKTVKNDIPVIMMSGNLEENFQKEALDKGATALLQKPFNLSEVNDIIELAIVASKKLDTTASED